MLRRKYLIIYILVVSVFGAGIYFMLVAGSHLRPREVVSDQQPAQAIPANPVAQPEKAEGGGITRVLAENLRDSLSILLLQIIVIIAVAKAVGRLFVKIGQPAVVGEMIAGILLGPSLMGWLFPHAFTFLFSPASLGTLKLLSQIGVILFVFLVGMELDVELLRHKAHTAVVVSHASIIIPFFLGITLSLALYGTYAPPNISFRAFALFIGIAMSITAFPVLARILEERRMLKTKIGNIAIACAAVDDLSAWCILGVVVAVVKAEGIRSSLLTIALALLFAGIMSFVVKPGLSRRAAARGIKEGNVTVLGSALVLVFTSALITEIIGIHAIFGAFVAGTVIPSAGGLRIYLREKLHAFCSVALLPIFFAFTGLRTQVNLVDDWQSWIACAAIIIVAVAGKLGGGMLAARFTAMNWRDSFSIGALMNTRGLMELIVLNIGYDLGILPARIFSMMVLMALITTAMTSPLLSAANWRTKQFSLRAANSNPPAPLQAETVQQ
jgi:Kef-type K+ transport system membrane component KefB